MPFFTVMADHSLHIFIGRLEIYSSWIDIRSASSHGHRSIWSVLFLHSCFVHRLFFKSTIIPFLFHLYEAYKTIRGWLDDRTPNHLIPYRMNIARDFQDICEVEVVKYRSIDVSDTSPTSFVQCILCWSDYELEDQIALYPCGHFIHHACYRQYKHHYSVCNVCFAQLPLKILTNEVQDRYLFYHSLLKGFYIGDSIEVLKYFD